VLGKRTFAISPKKMKKAGASAKMDVEIIAPITNAAPKAYLMINTMVRNKTQAGPNPIRKVIDMYTDYWKENFGESYKLILQKVERLW
jgi:hypothetical protein